MREIQWCDQSTSPIEISSTTKIWCDVKLTPQFKTEFMETRQWKDAVRLEERLNDLIEQYHMPSVIRRERRAIKRDFDRLFAILKKHCQRHLIDIQLIEP